jgi:hypothetical protein
MRHRPVDSSTTPLTANDHDRCTPDRTHFPWEARGRRSLNERCTRARRPASEVRERHERDAEKIPGAAAMGGG